MTAFESPFDEGQDLASSGYRITVNEGRDSFLQSASKTWVVRRHESCPYRPLTEGDTVRRLVHWRLKSNMSLNR